MMPNFNSGPCDAPVVHAPASIDLQAAYGGKNVLVAGADGFLGVNCAYALHAAGANVTLLSRKTQPRAVGFATRHVQADLRDAPAVAAAVEGHSFIFDMCGVSGAVGSNADPMASADQECRPHLNLFAAAAAAQSQPVVAFCSSRLVYGRPQHLPVDENHPISPASFYAVHKVTLEHYLQILASTRKLRACNFRLSNPYGPHWPTERKSYGLINQFIARALAGEPIDIFGEGSQRRDYIHVDDFMTAILSATATTACWGQTFNVGAAESISIREAVETIANQIDGTIVRFTPWPEEHLVVETGDYQTDLSKLKRYVDLPPQLTFDEGLRRTLDAVRAGLPVMSKKAGVSKAIITIYRRPPLERETATAGANGRK